ncbi:histidine kinase N-terminal 7TM domain-containing protein [Paenibacillus sp. YYML68]|uniref:histidine kinase N-terminal 7TM domain-containing diguanylate cyclase n=1 Tax=Paenibacillus sp. YYML68 TaxID=2909250 RepID=UPI0024922E99|nr:histidine kinase N-terminal 7TM domain-containing protein [Paenibacillus sp. YYML68]
MPQQLWMYIVMLIIGSSLSLGLCIYAFFRLKDVPGGKYYRLATLAAALFSMAYLGELSSSTLEQMTFWLQVEYIPLPFISVFTLLMCCDYVQFKLKRWVYRLLYLSPIVTIALQATNPYHHLYYKSMQLRPDVPFPVLQLEHGPLFAAYSLFSYGCLVAGVAILLWHARKVKLRFRLQIMTMVIGMIVPVIASLIYVGGKSPFGIDLFPVYLSVGFVFHCIALFRYQMFNVAPIARDIVFESMNEGVIVTNENDLIIDYNNAMLKVIPKLCSRSIGKPIYELLKDDERLFELVKQARDCDFEWTAAGTVVYYRLQFSPVRNRNGLQVGKIMTFVNITERVRMEHKLLQLASTDRLTELLNKTTLLQRSDEQLADDARSLRQVCVIMFDIDHFKKVNDTYGHGAGDLALIHAADTVRAVIRPEHLAGRYGGDEFIVFLPDTSEEDAYELAERIRNAIAGRPLTYHDQEVRFTSSFGVAHADLTDGARWMTMEQLIRKADQALYAAKRKGRNCVQVLSEYADSVGAGKW